MWNDSQPGVNGDMAKALLQGCLNIRGTAMVEPQGQQAQDVLQCCSRVSLTYVPSKLSTAIVEPRRQLAQDVLQRCSRVILTYRPTKLSTAGFEAQCEQDHKREECLAWRLRVPLYACQVSVDIQCQ